MNRKQECAGADAGTTAPKNTGAERATPDEQAAVGGLLKRHGELRTAKALGLSSSTVLRVAAGGEVRRATLVLMRLRLAEIARDEEP